MRSYQASKNLKTNAWDLGESEYNSLTFPVTPEILSKSQVLDDRKGLSFEYTGFISRQALQWKNGKR
jgi:hypothetical protein